MAAAGEQKQEKSNQPDSSEDELERKVEEKKKELRDFEKKLARKREERDREDEIARIKADYAREQLRLESIEDTLADFEESERERLCKELTPAVADRITDIAEQEWKALGDLRGSVAKQEEEVANTRKAVADRKERAKKAEDALTAMKEPVKTIDAKLKEAEAIRDEVAKSRNGGNLKVAFYLLKKLKQKLESEPKPHEADALEKLVRKAFKARDDTALDLAAAEEDLKDKEDRLKADRARLADFERTIETRIRDKVSRAEAEPPKQQQAPTDAGGLQSVPSETEPVS